MKKKPYMRASIEKNDGAFVIEVQINGIKAVVSLDQYLATSMHATYGVIMDMGLIDGGAPLEIKVAGNDSTIIRIVPSGDQWCGEIMVGLLTFRTGEFRQHKQAFIACLTVL